MGWEIYQASMLRGDQDALSGLGDWFGGGLIDLCVGWAHLSVLISCFLSIPTVLGSDCLSGIPLQLFLFVAVFMVWIFGFERGGKEIGGLKSGAMGCYCWVRGLECKYIPFHLSLL